ncbi:MAG TPA: cysteine--tRNA ligase [Tepidiformaceae bacterium]|nr:cysteine--tRNA ligase [Tepidiformaceae bacterium]
MQLHDSLSNKKKELRPISDEVRLYVCGITPYAESHIGHAVPVVVFDALRRYLEWETPGKQAFTVRHVTNFTDIDDKLIDRANALSVSVEELAEKFSDQYLQSVRRLNALEATVYPRATQEVPHIIEFIQGLIDRGAAYSSGGDVYYRVRKMPGYGKLSHRKVDDLRSGARIDPTELKDDPLDFALWKAQKPGEPGWESPWGVGRPGWHIECSALALAHLGEQIDIHGGGMDLIFPHHENEIAQTEAYTGEEFAQIWMHNALLQMGAEKMSKSLGNIIGLDETIQRFGSDAVRLFILSSHYRSPLTYSEDALEAAKSGAERLRTAAFASGPSDGVSGPDPEPFRERFVAAMEDDLGTPQAIAVLYDLGREVNRARDEGRDFHAAQQILRELAGVLGFTLQAPESKVQEATPFIDLLVTVRGELRAAKQFALADRVRDGLLELGIELRDGPDGTTWTAG